MSPCKQNKCSPFWPSVCDQLSLVQVFSYSISYHDHSSALFRQAQGNRGWSTSASTSAFPATSVCLCVSTTCQSDRVFCSLPPRQDQGNKVLLFSPQIQKEPKPALTVSFVPHINTHRHQWTSQALQYVSFINPSEREQMETGCHDYCQSPIVTLFMCNTLSGGTRQRLLKKDPFYPPVIVFPVTLAEM